MIRSPRSMFTLVFLTVLLAGPAWAQPQPAVTVSTDGRTLKFAARDAFDHVSLRVAAPDGRVFDREATDGALSFEPFAIEGDKLPDGHYTWEARVVPRGAFSADAMARARRNREREDPQENIPLRLAARSMVVQSGGFQIAAGKVIAGQGTEPGAERRKPAAQAKEDRASASLFGPRPASARHALFAAAPRAAPASRASFRFDQVIPDDLIVQGSECVGFDCVNNESFGFDTIRLKENNLRIFFMDTSVSPFPTTDWQLIANDSASGGLNRFSIQDVTGARTPFTVEAGAATNAVYVDATSDVGFRTAVPVLDLHVNTLDTPAFRMEQNNSGGFAAQTWDIAGNEANFFVRDVTGGSRLPLRIRPGAPTSTLDISAAGNVGIATASPQTRLHVFGTATDDTFIGLGPNPSGAVGNQPALNIGHAGSSFGRGAGFFNVRPDSAAVAPNPSLRFLTANVERMIITNTGNIGIGVGGVITNTIQTASGAHLTPGGVWTNASSREVKHDVEPLGLPAARAALVGLTPVTFKYRINDEPHVGFIAEDVPDLVATDDRKGLSAMDIVAVLTRVVQEQQQTVEAQQKQIADLRARLAAIEAGRR